MFSSSQDLLAKIALEDEVRKIPVVIAISKNDLVQLKALIDSGTDVNYNIPGSGKRPIHLAVESNNEEIVSYLIGAGANLNLGTSRNFTPLHVAAQKGNTQLIELLVSAKANISAITDSGTTPLHEAASRGQKEAVRKLIQLGADIDVKERLYNLTAANLAQDKGFTEIRDILVDKATYQQRFIQNVNYILFNWRRVFPENSPQFKFLNQLAIQIKEAENADVVFLKLREALKSSQYQNIKSSLTEAHKLFIANMNKYNENKSEDIKKTQELTSSSSPKP